MDGRAEGAAQRPPQSKRACSPPPEVDSLSHRVHKSRPDGIILVAPLTKNTPAMPSSDVSKNTCLRHHDNKCVPLNYCNGGANYESEELCQAQTHKQHDLDGGRFSNTRRGRRREEERRQKEERQRGRRQAYLDLKYSGW